MTAVILMAATLVFGFLGKDIPIIGIGAKDFMAGIFIWCGYMYRKHNYSFENNWWLIICSALVIAVGVEFWQTSMTHLKFYCIVPYILTAFLGTLMVFGLSRRLAVCENLIKRFLIFVGDNTLDILTWHFLSFKLTSLLLIWLYDLNFKRMAEFPVIEEYAYQGWWVLYLGVGLIIPLCISIAVKKFKKTK